MGEGSDPIEHPSEHPPAADVRRLPGGLRLSVLRPGDDLPAWLDRPSLSAFLHHEMKPYHDTLEDVAAGIDYALSCAPGRGGFVIVADREERLAGAVVILDTGMGGYVPAHLLLFVCVDPALRGQGIGAELIRQALARCPGAVKLHVEPDNPALRLYRRLGFEDKYLELRYPQP